MCWSFRIEKKKKEAITSESLVTCLIKWPSVMIKPCFSVESEEEDAAKNSPAVIIKSKVDENLSYMKQISDTFPRENG